MIKSYEHKDFAEDDIEGFTTSSRKTTSWKAGKNSMRSLPRFGRTFCTR